MGVQESFSEAVLNYLIHKDCSDIVGGQHPSFPPLTASVLCLELKMWYSDTTRHKNTKMEAREWDKVIVWEWVNGNHYYFVRTFYPPPKNKNKKSCCITTSYQFSTHWHVFAQSIHSSKNENAPIGVEIIILYSRHEWVMLEHLHVSFSMQVPMSAVADPENYEWGPKGGLEF